MIHCRLEHRARPRHFRHPSGAPVLGDERAGALSELDDAIMFEVAVRLRHRVGVDHEVLGHAPDRRKLIAGSEGADIDGVLHLFDQLEIHGHAGGWIRAKQYH